MRLLPILALLLVPGELAADVVRVAQLRVRERVVIRIPRVSARPIAGTRALPAPAIDWKEKTGPKCVPTGALAGALIAKPGTIDLVVGGGARYRAVLGDECPTLGFYSGFYLKPTRDGMVCADRDAIRSRSGGSCAIERFRRLEPRRPR